MSDGNRSDREVAAALYRELEATEDLPIEPVANRWLGEAQAVAGEIRGDLPEEARREGATDVLRLLEAIEGTDNERADDHVERALALAERLAQA